MIVTDNSQTSWTLDTRQQMIDHQARIIAYNNDYRLMMLTILPPMVLLFFMRRHARPAPAE